MSVVPGVKRGVVEGSEGVLKEGGRLGRSDMKCPCDVEASEVCGVEQRQRSLV